MPRGFAKPALRCDNGAHRAESAYDGLEWSFNRYFFLCFLALGAASAALQAQTMVPKLDDPGRKGDLARAEKQRAVERFDGFDQNKDGKLAKEEVANKSAYLTENFVKLDADKDGFLSWEEFLGHNRWPK